MKKSVFLTLILFAFSLQTIAAATSQMTGWCWIKDDGDENNATKMTVQDAIPVTITNNSQIIRLRVRVDNNTSDSKLASSLFYTTTLPTDTMVNFGTIDATCTGFTEIGPGACFNWANSAYVADGTNIFSPRISYNSLNESERQNNFYYGVFNSSSWIYHSAPYSYSELEYCIKPTTGIAPGKYYFIPGGNVVLNYGIDYKETFATLNYQGSVTPPIKSVKAISTDSIKAVIGNSFTLPVKSANIVAYDSVISFQFDLSYDPTKIKYVNYSTIGTLSENGNIMVNSSEYGKLKIGYISNIPITGAGALLNINFNALQTGTSTPVITKCLFNADSIKNISNSPIDIYTVMLGDIDGNHNIQAYDGALTLQYSVGLDPLPSKDPLPWADWRKLAADVDGFGGVTAYDAALILQRSINLISTFQGVSNLKNAAVDNAYITIERDGEYLLFKAYGNPLGLNIFALNNPDALGNPTFIKGALSEKNISNNMYSVGMATPYAPLDGTTILTIPIKNKTLKNISFDVTVNNKKSVTSVNLETSLSGSKYAKVTVSPNPATDLIHINNIKAGSVLSIYDLTGRKLTEKIAASTTESMSVENLNAGFYNLVILNGKDKAVTKIIKK